MFFSVASAWLAVSWLPFWGIQLTLSLMIFQGSPVLDRNMKLQTRIVVSHSLHVAFANCFGEAAAKGSGGVNPS